MSRFDLKFDLAVQAAKQLDAKIAKAAEAAFDEGMDFVRSACMDHQLPDIMAHPLHEPVVHTISYKARPIAPDVETPSGFIRYLRPKHWKAGQSLR